MDVYFSYSILTTQWIRKGSCKRCSRCSIHSGRSSHSSDERLTRRLLFRWRRHNDACIAKQPVRALSVPSQYILRNVHPTAVRAIYHSPARGFTSCLHTFLKRLLPMKLYLHEQLHGSFFAKFKTRLHVGRHEGEPLSLGRYLRQGGQRGGGRGMRGCRYPMRVMYVLVCD